MLSGQRYSLLLITLILLHLLVGCTERGDTVTLPPPEHECPITADWNGIIAGKSTSKEVRKILSEPDQIEKTGWLSQRPLFYLYEVTESPVAEWADHKVHFGADGTVDFIEVVASEHEGEFRPINEVIQKLGKTLDVVYRNTNAGPPAQAEGGMSEVQPGEDQIYVWANCGVAVSTAAGCSPTSAGELKCVSWEEWAHEAESSPTTITPRHSVPFAFFVPVLSDTDAMLMMFYFPPTSYDGFMEHYYGKIPYGTWEGLSRELDPS